jgi:hypothetical protein
MHSLSGEAQHKTSSVSHFFHVYRHVDDEELTDRGDFLLPPANSRAFRELFVRQAVNAILTSGFFDEGTGVKSER